MMILPILMEMTTKRDACVALKRLVLDTESLLLLDIKTEMIFRSQGLDTATRTCCRLDGSRLDNSLFVDSIEGLDVQSLVVDD